jgi:polar amino acid transport system substrate-binding protein
MARLILSASLALRLFITLTVTLSYTSISATELSEIQRRGKIVVAVKNNTRPLGYLNEQGKLAGLEIDLARHLAKELLGDENAVILKPVSNQDRLKVVIDNQVDIAIARVSDTSSRRRIVDLSPYYYLDGTGIITQNVTVANVEGLSKSKIAVLYGSTTIAIIRDRLPQAQLIGVSSYQEALNLLESKQVQAFAGDITVLTGWVQEYSQYKLLPERLSGEPLCIVMPKGLQHKELHLAVDKAIAKWRKSGWLQERIKRWGLP